ncbi:outer membrane protein [Shimia sp. W99]
MKTASLLTAVALVGAMATPALATDWTGFYGGAQLGFGESQSAGVRDDNAFGGLQAGYNYDFGDWVAGGEIEYRRPDNRLGFGTFDESVALKGRFGYDFDGTLFYGTAGVTRGSVSTGAGSMTDDGFVYGFGVERMLSNDWSVGLEVLKAEYNSFGTTGRRLEDTSAALKFNYRF